MKKLFNFSFLVISAVFIFVGCNKKETVENKTIKVGINQFAEHGSLDNCREGFMKGLTDNLKDINIVFDYQNAVADGALNAQISKTFAESKYDLLCGIATPSAEALYNAAEPLNIPVIYTAVSDPINAGLSNNDGFGNGITGTSDVLPTQKQLELIRKILPNAKKIGVLYTTNEKNSESQVNELKNLAPNIGFEVIAIGVSNKSEIPQALDQLLPQVDCLNNTLDNTVVQTLGLIIAKAQELKIPVFGSEIEQVKLGCIASEGIDYIKLGEQTGAIAARVINGEDINKIKFEIIQETQTYINKEAMEFYKLQLPSEITNYNYVDVE